MVAANWRSKPGAVDPAGIVYGSLRNGFGCGVEEGDGIGRGSPLHSNNSNSAGHRDSD